MALASFIKVGLLYNAGAENARKNAAEQEKEWE